MELDGLVFCRVLDCRFHFQDCAGHSSMKWLSFRQNRLVLFFAPLWIIGFVLLFPLRSEAYAGPGAGFAVLSSFWTLFVAFLYSVYAFLVWPFRQLFRLLRRRKAYGKAQI